MGKNGQKTKQNVNIMNLKSNNMANYLQKIYQDNCATSQNIVKFQRKV